MHIADISREDVIKLSIEHNLLLSSFSNNKVNLINYLSNFKELWQDEKNNKIIEDNHLKNINLNELFYQNTNKDNLESYREQCRKLLNKELNYIDKGNLESSNKRITDFITEMNSKENVFQRIGWIAIRHTNTK